MTLRSVFRTLLPMVAVAVAAVALAGWWARDVPALQGWLPQALQRLPDAASPRAGPGATTARKCRSATQLLYTDGPCPAGLREEAVAGGSVSVLPAAPATATATATAPAPAGSAQTPLRRLAGPDDLAAQRERVLEQALHR